MKANTFDEVAKLYADITPLRGGRADKDIRPLGKRSRWYEAVRKISDTTYALCDGTWGNHSGNAPNFFCPPVVWERRSDGDYITIRNNGNDSQSISRYRFLSKYLPWGFHFYYTNNGRHYVRYKDVDHYLPKFRVEYNTGLLLEDAKLVFKCLPDGTFERANDLHLFKTGRVDKVKDKEVIPKIKEMWKWMEAVLPVLGDTLRESVWDHRRKFSSGGWSAKCVGREVVMDILNNPEHEMRLSLAVIAVAQMSDIHWITGRWEPKESSERRFIKIMREVADVYIREPR